MTTVANPNSERKSKGRVLRFALIGAGRIAQSYAQAFRSATNAQLAAVVDVNHQAAARLAAAEDCLSFASHLDLDLSRIDAVAVATPPATHGPICRYFLERGIAVLCEKPVSLDVETARDLRSLSRQNEVLFTMASKFRYAEDVLAAKQIVDTGVLGEVVFFENTFMSHVDMTGRWNAQPEISGGGVFIDNGTHSVDIMRYFIGPLTSIHLVAGPGRQNLSVEETAHVTVRSSTGAIGRMNLSWSLDTKSEDYIAIHGTRGSLRVGWKRSCYLREGDSTWTDFGRGYDKVQAFRDQLENFSSAVQGLEPLRITADDAVASVEAILAGYAALARNTWSVIGAVSPTAATFAA